MAVAADAETLVAEQAKAGIAPPVGRTEHVATPSMDYPEHQRTYDFFLKLLGYVAGGVIAILVLLAYFTL